MVVFPKQCSKHLFSELPFMATEKILMEAVNRGVGRQEAHEIIKEHSLCAGKIIKEDGEENDLLRRLSEDVRLPFSFSELQLILENQKDFVGRAPQQTEEYLNEIVYPLLERYKAELDFYDSTLTV